MSSYFELGMDKKLIVPAADYLNAMEPDFEYVGDKLELLDVVKSLNLPSANSVKIVSARGAGASTLLDALVHHQHDGSMPDDFMIRPLYRFNGNNLYNTSDPKAIEARFKAALDELRAVARERMVKPVLLIDDGCSFICNAPQSIINNFIEATVTADYLDTVICVDRKQEAEFNAKHPEFSNSFTTKELKEPGEEQIFTILKSHAKLHAAKGVLVEDDTLRYLIGITQRFKGMYEGTAQPNRSIRLLDSAATAFHMDIHAKAPGAYEKESLLRGIEAQLNANGLDAEKKDSLHSQAETLRIELEESGKAWSAQRETIKSKQGDIRQFEQLIATARRTIEKFDDDTRKTNAEMLRKHVDGLPDGHPDLKGRQRADVLKLDQDSLLKFGEFDLAVSRNPQVLPYEQQIAKYNTAIQKLHTDLNQLGGVKRDPVVLPASEIEKAASAETRQPVGGISGRLKDNLRNGMALMKESVFGQDDVLAPIVASLQRAATGLNDPNRPLGTFMIAGPPGVGKSWIGKQIALKLFGSEEFFEVVDMENYKEKHTVSALLGAPPGYEGYGKLGKLIEIGQKKPFCVLLLDEIEKAHYDVRQALLKMKGSGRLVGFDGEEADFRNIVIVETTNYGQDIWVSHDFKTAESLFQDRIRHDTTVFSPEYLDRNDAVLCAKPLDEQALTQIVGREVGKLQKAAARKNPDLKIDYRPEELNLFVRDHCLNVSGRRAEMMINKIFGDRVAGLLLESGDAPLSGTLSARRDPATKEFVFNFAAGDSAPAPQAAAVFGRLAV